MRKHIENVFIGVFFTENYCEKRTYHYDLIYMKKILSFLIIFSFSFWSIYAASGTILMSPFFITDPIREVTPTNHPKKSIIQKKNPYKRIAESASIEFYESRLRDIYKVQVNLKNWLRVLSLGSPIEWDQTSGEPLYPKKTLKELKTENSIPLTLAINGQFFDPKKNPTPLSFGLKEGGEVRTAWADNRNESKKIIIFGSWYAQILPYSWEHLRDASGDFALVSLSLDTPNFPLEDIGRTYICLQNPDYQNISDRILVFFTRSLSEYSAERILRSEWCTRNSSIKLDSSGSSQIIFGDIMISGNAHKGYPDNRKIPHAIGFIEI